MDSGMSGTADASACAKIDALLGSAGWSLAGGSIVLFRRTWPGSAS